MYLSFEQRSSAHEKSILWLWFVVRGPLRDHSGHCYDDDDRVVESFVVPRPAVCSEFVGQKLV